MTMNAKGVAIALWSRTTYDRDISTVAHSLAHSLALHCLSVCLPCSACFNCAHSLTQSLIQWGKGHLAVLNHSEWWPWSLIRQLFTSCIIGLIASPCIIWLLVPLSPSCPSTSSVDRFKALLCWCIRRLLSGISWCLQPRTKVFVHLSTQIFLFSEKIILKTTWGNKSALKDLLYATKLITVALFV